MKYAHWASIVAISATIAGCSHDHSKQYFPDEKVGTRHQYDMNFQVLGQLQKATMIISVDGEETINQRRYKRILTTTPAIPGDIPSKQFLRWTSNGIYQIDPDAKGSDEYLETPFPIAVGSKWTVTNPGGTEEYEVVDAETVELPDQEYKECLKIAFSNKIKVGTGAKGFEYMAPGVGMVKMDVDAGGMAGSFSFTLQPPKK